MSVKIDSGFESVDGRPSGRAETVIAKKALAKMVLISILKKNVVSEESDYS